jgi:hypothetical protein
MGIMPQGGATLINLRPRQLSWHPNEVGAPISLAHQRCPKEAVSPHTADISKNPLFFLLICPTVFIG